MKYYIDKSPINNTHLYNKVLEIGKTIEEKYELFSEHSDKGKIKEIYFEESLNKNFKQLKMDTKEDELIEYVLKYYNFNDELKSLYISYGYSCPGFIQNKEQHILKLCHIVYIIDSIIYSLSRKKPFYLAIYMYYNNDKYFSIYKRNMEKKLLTIIDYFFSKSEFTIILNNSFELDYITDNYWNIIKFTLYLKLKSIIDYNEKYKDIMPCMECGYLFFKKKSDNNYCNREYCNKLRQASRKRKSRAKNKI